MKKIILVTTSVIIFCCSNLTGQNGTTFEYKISSNKGASGSIKTYFSSPGSRVEMQMNMPQAGAAGGTTLTTIVKNSTPAMVNILDDKNKTYISTEIPKKAITGEDNRTVKVIGKEKVGNYNCIHVIVTEGTKSREYWTTTEIADYENYTKANANTKFIGSNNDQDILAKNNAAGFVVKMISKDANGVEQTIELVKTEKKDLSTGLFEVPADYKASAITAPAK